VNYLEKIENLRAQIAEKHGTFMDVANQYTSRARATRMADERIEKYAASGAASCKWAIDKLAAGHPAGLFVVTATVNTDQGSYPVRIDLGPLLTQLLGTKAVRKSLDAMLQAVPEGLPHATRAERMDALNDELDLLETQEEHLIREAELTGLTIARRPDADPAIVLAREVGK
jgi:hypothetical protein